MKMNDNNKYFRFFVIFMLTYIAITVTRIQIGF